MDKSFQTGHARILGSAGVALVLAFFVGSARAENLVINGDFSWQLIGTTAAKSGAGGQADSTTFSNWRLFTVDATNGTYLRGTIVSNPVVGGAAMRLDYVRAGPAATDFGLDRDTSRMPVVYRQGYTVSFDVAFVGGSTNLQLVLPEFKSDHSFVGQQVVKTVSVSNGLAGFRVLLLSYHGQKPLSPDVHAPLVDWVRRGGGLVVVDDDSDPCNAVREWWNSDGLNYATPREHLFEQLGLPRNAAPFQQVGKGAVCWMRENPAKLAAGAAGDAALIEVVKQAATHARVDWRETNCLLLRRGPYVIAAGLDESVAGEPKDMTGRFVNLFDPELCVHESVKLDSGVRLFLLDLDAVKDNAPHVLASACKALATKTSQSELTLTVEGVANTPAVVLIGASVNPKSVALAGQPLNSFVYSEKDRLLWVRFANEARPRELTVKW